MYESPKLGTGVCEPSEPILVDEGDTYTYESSELVLSSGVCTDSCGLPVSTHCGDNGSCGVSEPTMGGGVGSGVGGSSMSILCAAGGREAGRSRAEGRRE